MSLANRWQAFRSVEGWRWATMVAAIGVGLVAAWFHWLGLFLGGALVGLASATRGRALLAGFGFGVLVVSIFVVTLFVGGDLTQYLAMGQIVAISLALPPVAAAFAALSRWLV
ncbi:MULTISPECIES: hypothetical protein [Halococcus]|uniref:Uncharacterized protein n=1 Tax=Halococcus salifodinae DSM 8989 TaxID=1227456 RepID=M0N7J8_9EURY|nr:MULTISPECIES: hypothetical protein [Halococcus]EMA52645.1 hypothetical protein C450_11118 [Halococcus salifodinae DSM 8989]